MVTASISWFVNDIPTFYHPSTRSMAFKFFNTFFAWSNQWTTCRLLRRHSITVGNVFRENLPINFSDATDFGCVIKLCWQIMSRSDGVFDTLVAWLIWPVLINHSSIGSFNTKLVLDPIKLSPAAVLRRVVKFCVWIQNNATTCNITISWKTVSYTHFIPTIVLASYTITVGYQWTRITRFDQ